MRSLFWKGMLAFLAVILVAVGIVAILAERVAEAEFRRYAFTHGGTWDQKVTELAAYYASHGSWEGVQDALSSGQGLGRQQGRGQGGGWGMGAGKLDFRLADSAGQVVGDTASPPSGTVSQAELASNLPIEVQGQVIGYLLPVAPPQASQFLDLPQTQFLTRIQGALWVAALAALATALVVGGLLFRSIIAPLRRLTAASQAITKGDLSARASIQGRDEVAQLADAFNRMAESLTRAEEARQNQTADIAHELRTPLTVLQGTLEAMLDGVYPVERKSLLAALAQVRMLARLVEDLRLLALADAGRLRVDVAPLDLGAFLQEVVEAHQVQAHERVVDLALEMPPDLPRVRADRDRLAQVMANLLSNALRYVPEGGHVAVRAMVRRREVVVAVVDDGPGVRPEDLPHLFERFWRGDPARRRSRGGSGLGLTIARHIVEAHGGRVWAELAPGGGLGVAFALPVEAA
jgi:two-component system sensor histidine kinase BaeS